jgi:dephospho-CoA kinase
MPAKDIVDLQVAVENFEVVDDREAPLLAAGFVNVQRIAPDAPAVMLDDPHGERRNQQLWAKRPYAGLDDDRLVIAHVRRSGSPCWRYALRFRDWLRANEGPRREDEELRSRLVPLHADDANFDDYARAKGSWFASAYSASEQWAEHVAWSAPAGDVNAVPVPVRFSDTPPVDHATAPELGQHTMEILEELGYSADDTAALAVADAI